MDSHDIRHATRAFRGLVLAFATSSVGFGVMAPFLVIWAHRDAGLAGSAAGLLFVAQAAGELTGGLAGGMLADRLGARQVLLVSTAGMTVGYGALWAIAAPAPALAAIFGAGLFEAAFHPTALALVADLKPAGDRAAGYGVIRAWGNVGTVLGPLAGAVLVAGAPIDTVFLLAAGLLLASGAVLVVALPARGPRVSLEEEVEELQAAVPGIKAIARDRRLARLVFAGIALAIAAAWWEADGLALVRTQRHFTTGEFSIMLAAGAAITAICQIPISRLTRRLPRGRLLVSGAVLEAAGLALLAAAPAGLVFVVAAVAGVALGQMLYAPNASALVSEIAPAGRGATYQAASSTTVDIGMAIGPASGLALGGAVGARVLWLLGLPLGAAAAVATGRVSACASESWGRWRSSRTGAPSRSAAGD